MQATQVSQRTALDNGCRKRARARKPKEEKPAAPTTRSRSARATGGTSSTSSTQGGRAHGWTLMLAAAAALVLMVLCGCSSGLPRVTVGSEGICISMSDAPPIPGGETTTPAPIPEAHAAFEKSAPTQQEVTLRVIVEQPPAPPGASQLRATSSQSAPACDCK